MVPDWKEHQWTIFKVLLGGEFLGGPVVRLCTFTVEGVGLIPGLERSPGEGKGYPLQYSGLENSMGLVAKSQTQLSVSLFTATGLVAGANILWVDGGALFSTEYLKVPQGIPILFIYKKEKVNLLIEMPKGRWINQTLF